MRCFAIPLALYLLMFFEFSLSHPNLLSNAVSPEMPRSAGTAKFRAGLVFTDVDYYKLREALAEEEDVLQPLTDEEIKMRLSITYPYTKWCGPGNRSTSFEELGSASEADKCCRAHDTCPGALAAGKSKEGLTNDAFYTRLSCECDETFRQCLHAANTMISNQIGKIYFNYLGTQCYRKDYPIIKCKEYGGFLNRICLKYELSECDPQIYQWFYVPTYGS